MRLKDVREDRDVTQREIAEYLHIKQNTYSQYETGQRGLPVDILIKLAEYYRTSTDYLLGLTNDSRPYADFPNKTDSLCITHRLSVFILFRCFL